VDTASNLSETRDPLWYKDAILYQLHLKAFKDSTGSGMGDFRGLIQKLDYLEELGITALWLLPFYPSPRRDDGYDISDYFSIHPDYGTLRDFKKLLSEAHRRSIRVITELVLNHTSDQHSWFQRARHAPPNSSTRDFYVWSDTPERYTDVRIIFTDFESSNWSWDPVAKAYFWHRFYAHQPDLNFESPQVRKIMFRAIDFWLDMGVDGLRLDAVPYLFEREGTNCENLPETYQYLRELRSYIDGRYRDRMLLAEANQWPEDAVAYFGEGDICHTAFHFPLMPRMYIALQMEDRFPITDILDQTPQIPDSCQWVTFLRNHDELTLEMVTDEERDYMYSAYARDTRARINVGIRRRLAPLLSNDRRMIELLNVLLLSLPGTPVIYYGDEIGMGDNYYLGDRNGVRTPMQWSPGKNAGFSEANPQRLYLPVIIDPEYHYEAINVETQASNPASLLWWMRRIIATRKGIAAFGRGSFRILYPDNPRIFTFVREYEDETVLVVVNLSRTSQAVEIDLSDFSGATPVEVFSRNRFPRIGESLYPLTLGPHGYFWFTLEKERAALSLDETRNVISVKDRAGWNQLPYGVRKKLQSILVRYLQGCRWFGEKSLTLQKVSIADSVPVQTEYGVTHILFLEVSFSEKSPVRYVLPLSLATREQAAGLVASSPRSVVAHVRVGEEEGVVYDGLYNESFCERLLQLIGGKKRYRGRSGELRGYHASRYRRLLDERGLSLGSRLLKGEQSNTSVLFDDLLIMKLYRRLDDGLNPDVEITRHLTEKAGFPYIPPYAGSISYVSGEREAPICLFQQFVQNQGDAWSFTLNTLEQCYTRLLAELPRNVPPAGRYEPLQTTAIDEIPQLHLDYLGGFFLEMVGLLGERTAQMHNALGARTEDPQFRPEPLSALYMRSLYQSMRSQTRRSVGFLKKRLSQLSEQARTYAKSVADGEEEILRRQGRIMGRKMEGSKIRTHGDFHLGQVLFTGKDFMIIDFEGEPARPIGERRIKRSPLRDVAGMIRSFHYAVSSVYQKHPEVGSEQVEILKPWAAVWFNTLSGVFLGRYLEETEGEGLLPADAEDLSVLMEAYLLEKAMYELMYELNNRPDWAVVPLRGLCDLLGVLEA
jgi:maltose alpha-D-glucosyltransferase/alpha-amylase